MAFLALAGLAEEIEHLQAVEERLSVGSNPALHHAALSTRLLLKGVADHCFPPRDEKWANREGRSFKVGPTETGNRIIAFVESAPGTRHTSEELRLFIALMDTVSRFSGRGPHRVYSREEADTFFLRVLEVLDHVSRGYFARQFQHHAQRFTETG